MRKSIIVFFFFLVISALSQNDFTLKSDWLKHLGSAKEDTLLVENLYKFGQFLENENMDTAKIVYLTAKKIADKLNYIEGEVKFYFNYTFILNYEGKYEQAKNLNNTALVLAQKSKRSDLIAKCLYNLATSYSNIGDHKNAISNYLKSLKYFESKGANDLIILNYSAIGGAYNNIAFSTNDSFSLRNAKDYYLKAILLSRKTNNQVQLANACIYLGNTENTLNQLAEANRHLKEGLSLAILLDNNKLMADAYSFLMSNCKKNQDNFNAIIYGEKAYAIAKQTNNIVTLITTLKFLALTYLEMKDVKQANAYIEEALALVETTESYVDRLYIYSAYSQIKGENKEFDKALTYSNKYYEIKDSLRNTEILKSTQELQTKYETEKKEAQLKQASADLNFQEQKNKQQKIVISLGTVAITLILFFLVVAFINFKKAKKANTIINNQNQVLELQKKEVQSQKEIIEEKQHEIISSITYAQRIQSAVLTGEDVWNKLSKEHFIVFQPRDIVSGDFYWAHVLPNGRAVFALADCTGHGVPGGFMSMLGNSFLNELVVENKLFKANEILNRLREKVISALFQKGQTQQKDGMDMALCVWNKMDNTLEFAGANNALYLVRDGELIEYKGDKMPIGTYLEENKPFTSQVIALKPNDMIYLTTDGFADQFGGEKGKKFKYKQLENLLIEIATSEPQQQKETLTETFKQWKSNYEQTDDMSVIGIKVA